MSNITELPNSLNQSNIYSWNTIFSMKTMIKRFSLKKKKWKEGRKKEKAKMEA